MVADWDTFSDIDDDRVPSDREETHAEAHSGIITNYDLVWYNGICAQNHSFYDNHHYRGDCLMIKTFHPDHPRVRPTEEEVARRAATAAPIKNLYRAYLRYGTDIRATYSCQASANEKSFYNFKVIRQHRGSDVVCFEFEDNMVDDNGYPFLKWWFLGQDGGTRTGGGWGKYREGDWESEAELSREEKVCLQAVETDTEYESQDEEVQPISQEEEEEQRRELETLRRSSTRDWKW